MRTAILHPVTLAIMLATSHGFWASTDQRLMAYPTRALISDSSLKQVVMRCRDGAALVSYTGLGRVGALDVSAWMRQILRGESRTVDETLIDLREQATERFGREARRLGVPHIFFVGAFLHGRPWAIEIRNFAPATGISLGGIQSTFHTAGVPADKPMVGIGGAGRDAILPQDRALLDRVVRRIPRRPEEFMRLLGDINRRAAESKHRSAATVSRSCRVIFMPPSGDGVKHEWYGPEEERHLAPAGTSSMLFGVDMDEIHRSVMSSFEAWTKGEIAWEERCKRVEDGARASIRPSGRRNRPPQ